MLKKGVFTISIDVEMAWGTFDHGGQLKYKDAYARYRPIIGRLLELFREYQIPATWAIVGHLFLDNCRRENGLVHPQIPRPRHSWFKGDWFRLDPGTDIARDPSWYGSDIVKMVKSALPKQEIASHSFAHPIFADKGCSKEAAEADIAKCVELAKKEGVNLVSFIFPRNAPAHLGVLAKYGFKVFRGEGDAYSRIRPKMLRKIYLLFSDMAALKPPVVVPRKISHSGLVEVGASMLFRFVHGKSRFIPRGMRLKRAKKGLDAAVREKKIFHLWFHPISFAWDTERLFDEFRGILEYADSLRKKGKLEISTLGDISEKFSKDEQSDKFNPEAIILHNHRSGAFQEDYLHDLADYYANAFKYGRKSIEGDFLSYLDSFPKGSRILDLGCGTGYYLNLMRGRGLSCVGVDIAENMLRRSKEAYPESQLARADARSLPFADASFDGVISIETLRYFKDRAGIIREISRVTRPQGRVFITAAPLFSTNLYGIYNTLCRFFGLGRWVSCYQSFETVNSLKKLLSGQGFRQVNVRGHFFGPFYFLDKAGLRANQYLLRSFEPLDRRLSRRGSLRNFSNHLVAVAGK
jgi:SAM-dependent methyltransferase/peptidoglycan/xylan/chitin deacetylase (PgdA/CDA1 family)